MEVGLHAKHFEEHRGLMYSIAYRMLGNYSEAEDAVQDAYVRWRKVNLKQVESPAAYLASTVSRLCIDKQRRQKVDRMLYKGPWLPEPLDDEYVTDVNDPEYVNEKAESISIAFMLLLENLAPLERAVFILRESFDLPHDQIAEMLDIKPAHSRQLFRRAKAKFDQNEVPDEAIADDPIPLMEKFIAAATTGNLDELHALMTDDIIAYSDGGGRASAAIIPLVGKDRVSTVLMHLLRKEQDALHMDWQTINGEPALVFSDASGIHSVHSVQVKGGKLHRVYTMRNPDKLRHVSVFQG